MRNTSLKTAVLRFGCAVACVGAATAIRLSLDPILGDLYPFPTFMLAVVAAAWFGGLPSAVMAVLLGALAVDFFVMPPRGSFLLNSREQWVGLGLFVGTGLGIALLDGGRHAVRTRANEARLRLMADAMPQIVWASGSEGSAHYLNNRWTEYTGRTTSRPDDIASVIHPDDLPRVNTAWAEARRTVTPYQIELRMKSALDGTYRWFLTRAVPVQDAAGRTVEWFGTSTDIEDLKAIGNALHRSEAMLKTVLDNIPLGVFWKDRESRYLGCNRTAAAGVGCDDPASLLGRTDAEIGYFPPELVAEFVRRDRAVMAADAPQYDIVESHPRSDGTLFWLSKNKIPLHDDRGDVTGVLATFQDITERKAALEAVHASRAMLQLVLDNIPQGVIWKDRASRYLGCNDVVARAMGLAQPAEIAGRTDAELTSITAEQSAQFVRMDREVMNADCPRLHIVEPMTLVDGRTIWLDTNKVPMHDEAGRVIGLLATWEDITERKATEEALRISERRFRALLEQGRDNISIHGADNAVLYISPSVERVEGYTLDELAGRNGLEDIHPDDLPGVLANIGILHANPGMTMPVLWRRRHKDGRWLVLEGLATNLLHDPAIRGIVTNYRDVTDSKRLENEREKLARLIDESKDFIAMADLDGRLTFINSGARRMIGLPADTVPRELLFTQYVPDDWQTFFRDTVIRTARESGYWEGEMQIQHLQTGARIDVFRSTFLIRDRAGQPECFATVTRDITSRKRGEESLRESESRFRQLAESIPQLAWITDCEGAIQWYNQRWYDYTGTNLEQMQGWGWQTVHDPQELPRVLARFQQAVAAGDPWEDTFPLRRHDGAMRWHLSRAMPIKDDTGAITRWFGTNTDISDQRDLTEALSRSQAELEDRVRERTRELEAVNKELEAFSYSVSHDLRAPLRAIDGFSRIIAEDFGPRLPADALAFLQDIRTNTRLMGRLVDDLLSFSRLGRKTVAKHLVPMDALVRKCVEELRESFAGRRVEIRIDDLPPGQADPALLKQVWLNLLSNALKYTARRDPAVIEIGGRHDAAGSAYYIRDNGVGFDMRYVHKLFGVFQRLHRAEEFEGTGVGLAIVQRVIHRHGGQVAAEAELDRGALFSFTLPFDEGVS